LAKELRIILGIDPGFGRLGWGVIRASGSSLSCLGYGCIETHSTEEFATRLALIDRELALIIEKYNPTDISVEELFFAKNVKTAMQVAHARGVVLLRAVNHCGNIFEYKPNQIKQAITGTGSADKKQIQFMITRILALEKTPKPDDAADALAIAVTHSAYIR
jgi:crossover junction endodeoxyribonuclease RuvC